MKNTWWNEGEELLDDQGELVNGSRPVPWERKYEKGCLRWTERGVDYFPVVPKAWLDAYERQWELEGPHP